jgi:alkanesulfonate monooxygenase SsuD/methylene tetrahydromethanopterin reductase-like flavin-dependent oxidoreductase (luciferase family)
VKQQLQFGIIILPDLPFDVLVERWRYVEALGFDAVYDCDHFVNPYNPQSDWFDGWTLLAALATQTQRIRIGSLVTPISLHNPAQLARQAMTVDRISGGRLELALGTGGSPLDHRMTGIPLESLSERVRRFGEFVEVVDTLLRNETTSHSGNYYRLENARMSPNPVQRPRPPLTIAAHGAKMLEVAARFADCWNSYAGNGISHSEALEVTRQRNLEIDDNCVRLGRDPGAVRRSLLVGITAETPFASMNALQDFVGAYLETGIHEFIFYWMREKEPGVLSRIGERSLLEQVADTVAKLRTSHHVC